MKPIRITKRLEFDAGHRVPGHDGKCRALHGHRYAVEITCEATQLDEAGFVVDFGIVKKKVGAWIDEVLDHAFIVWREDPALEAILAAVKATGCARVWSMAHPPTAENIAELLLTVSRSLLTGDHWSVVAVRVYETPTSWADAEA